MVGKDLSLKDLDNFSGTEQYYNVFGVNVTDGVNDLLQDAALKKHATDEDIKAVWSILRKTYGYKKVNMVQAAKYGVDWNGQ